MLHAGSRWEPAYVVCIVRDADGAVLYLTTGDKVRSMMMFEIVNGELKIEPADDDC
jgi:hypothetical protein